MKLWRKIHKYFGIAAVVLIVLVSMTGILLTHDEALGLEDLRANVPGYANSMPIDAFDAAVLGDGSTLIATRQGVFRSCAGEWELVLAAHARNLFERDGVTWVAAREGLFESRDGGVTWIPVIPEAEIRAIGATSSGILAASRHDLYRRESDGRWIVAAHFAGRAFDVREIITTPAGDLIVGKEGVYAVSGGGLAAVSFPIDSRQSGVELKKLIKDLHTGELFGDWFVVVSDANAITLVLLSLTGAWLWWYPRHRKRQVVAARAAAQERKEQTGLRVETES